MRNGTEFRPTPQLKLKAGAVNVNNVMFKPANSCLSEPMEPLLKLLRDNAALRPAQLAAMLNASEADIEARIKEYEKNQIILGYRTVVDEEKLGLDLVRAVIEVKITPEREGGFNRLAERIAKYREVRS